MWAEEGDEWRDDAWSGGGALRCSEGVALSLEGGHPNGVVRRRGILERREVGARAKGLLEGKEGGAKRGRVVGTWMEWRGYGG